MEPNPQTDLETVSFDRLLEFDDDVNMIGAEPEFAAPVAIPSVPGLANGQQVPLARPSAKDAAAAKKIWLPIIRKCTEPVPSAKAHLRPLDAGTPSHGRILIDYQRGPRRGQHLGSEVDVSDKMFLLLFDRQPSGPKSLVESTVPVLWTDIANIRFEIERPIQDAQGS